MGIFFSELAPQLSLIVPKAWYTHADMATGEKVVLMERLEDAVPAGVFFGSSNPNNWGMREQLEVMHGQRMAAHVSRAHRLLNGIRTWWLV